MVTVIKLQNFIYNENVKCCLTSVSLQRTETEITAY